MLTSESLHVMALQFQTLTTINLAAHKGNDRLSSVAFHYLFKHVTTLIEVNLSNNLNVSTSSFHPQADHAETDDLSAELLNAQILPNMQILTLEGCPNLNDGTLTTIGTMMPELRVLIAPDTMNFNHSVHLIREGAVLHNHVEPFKDFKVFQNLEVLDVSGSYNIDDDFVQRLCVNNPNLRKLYLGDGEPVDDEFDENRNHLQVTTRCFNIIARHCPKMRELKIENSLTFGNYHTENIPYPPPNSLPHLTVLLLNYSKQLTTSTLINICHTSPALQYLSVAHCPTIQQSAKISSALTNTYYYIEPTVPNQAGSGFVGFHPSPNYASLYHRDAYFDRVELERSCVALIMKNYKCYKANTLHRWWSAAKKIKRAFNVYKFKRTCAGYTKFTGAMKRKRAATKRRRKEVFMRVFLKIRTHAINIQRIYRGHDARCTVNGMLDEIDATVIIQATWRGVRCRLDDLMWVMKKDIELKRLKELIKSGVFLPEPSEPFVIEPSIRTKMPQLRALLNEVTSRPVKATANKNPQVSAERCERPAR